ncbi:MAG: cupredoxin domain-containing protein [Gammaproteobacteria bacterium]|nr:cupredoxin domain-containing protein [Gammaproteobacteria bacterium]
MKLKSLSLVLLAFPVSVWAADAEILLTIKDHRFEPAEVRIPADKKIKLVIKNLDATPEEFESHDLNREKVITPGGKVTIFIGPLKPGKYPFYGEFNQDTARGVVIAE